MILATSISYSEGGWVRARVVNILDRPAFVSEIYPIAVLDVEFTIGEARATRKNRSWDELTEDERALVSRATIGAGGNLTEAEKLECRDLLGRYVDVFARDGTQQRTHAISVKLDLVPGAKPHRHQTQ